MTATVILVGADKGGVGKTMTARALLSYLAWHNVPVRAFDSQPGGDLVRYAPDAAVINLASVKDQMRIFDGVSDQAMTVVDICAGLLSPTIRALDEAQLLDDVRAGSVRLVLLHVLGATLVSIGEIATASRSLGEGVRHFIVKNEGGGDFEAWKDAPIFTNYTDTTITIEALPDEACNALEKRAVEGRDGSFLSFMNDSAESKYLRGRTNSWLRKVWAEFERVNVRGPDLPKEGEIGNG